MNRARSFFFFPFIVALLMTFFGCAHQERTARPTPDSTVSGGGPREDAGFVRSEPSRPGQNVALPRPAMGWTAAGSFREARRTPADVTAIVIHTTEGRYDDQVSFAENQRRNYEGTIRYFQNNNRNVSTHYMVGPNGEIRKMVRERDVAFTQTYYNDRSIGIECAGWSDRPETWTPDLMEALVSLTAYLAVKWEVQPNKPAGTAWEGPNRIELVDGSHRFTGEGLVGHYQIQPWNKTDPGPHFPWEEFAQRVRERINSASAGRGAR